MVFLFTRMINEAMKCFSCLSRCTSSEFHGTGEPMLDDEPASGPAVEHFVDEDALTDIEVVVLSRPEVQAEVTICGAQS